LLGAFWGLPAALPEVDVCCRILPALWKVPPMLFGVGRVFHTTCWRPSLFFAQQLRSHS
jgi:hypothetical protein